MRKQSEAGGGYLLHINSNSLTLNLNCKAKIHCRCRQSEGRAGGTVRVNPAVIPSSAADLALGRRGWVVTPSSLHPLPALHLSSTNPGLRDLCCPRRNYPPCPKRPSPDALSLSVSFLCSLFHFKQQPFS